jgi:AraC-like DNA-binding protein
MGTQPVEVDALSEILRVVQMSGAFFVNARFSAPWCYQSPKASLAAPWLAPSAEQIVIFHLVTEGDCLVEMEGIDPLPVHTGDVVLFPTGCAHRMASRAGLAPPRGPADLKKLLSARPRRLAYGGGGAPTRIVCGYLACDTRLARLLLNGLPPVVRVSLRDSGAGQWLESSVGYALAELARAAGSSRSVLAERFMQLVGTSPMQYLTQWRMVMAANLLRCSSTPLARVAEEVGYQNDTSFSRAFRREYGLPPAAWRRNVLTHAAAAP